MLGFSKQDEVTIVFCGAQKTLATGVPMANVLFPGAQAGVVILPLMIYHQLQLTVCAWLAQRYARGSARRSRRRPNEGPGAWMDKVLYIVGGLTALLAALVLGDSVSAICASMMKCRSSPLGWAAGF